MSKILDTLYVAGVQETFDDKQLTSNVTHMLNVANEVMISERIDHIYHKIGINDDDVYSDISTIILPCVEWIHDAIKGNGVVCVHCLEGKSRSVCICIAYMCCYHNMTFDNAIKDIKRVRPCIEIFPIYEQQLRNWVKNKDDNMHN